MSQSLGHDPLCTWRQAEEADAGDPRRWLAGGLAACDCDLIAKVREDEQLKQYEAQSGNWEDGYFHGIAKCIAAVDDYAEVTHKHFGDLFGHCRHEYGDRCDITAALHAVADQIRLLQEKP